MTAEIFDVAVIGGGLHGLSAALHLAREGARVVVLERRWVGRHSSGASAAGVRTLGRNLGELPLCLESDAMWHDIEALVGDDCGFHAHGQVQVAETEADLAVLRQRVELMHRSGYRHEELIGADELRRLVPGIAPHCLGAIIVRSDGAADPHRTLLAFRRAAEASGVAIREQEGIAHVEQSGRAWRLSSERLVFEAGHVVNAAGAWAAKIAAMVGDAFRIGTKASMMIVTERVAEGAWPVVSSVGRKLSFKQTDRGTLLIGGGTQGRYDLDAEQATVDFVSLAAAARAATDLFPCSRDVRILRSWAGLEAKTEDNLPVICRSPNAEGVVYVFGFSGHGFQLVPVAGAVVADLVLRGATWRPIAALDACRLLNERAAA